MITYVAGFALTPTSVLLVRKTKPAQLAGKWNAVGGKVDPGETAAEAMEREFAEEIGVIVSNWKQFCSLRGNYPLNGEGAVNFVVEFYYARLTVGFNPPRTNDCGEWLAWFDFSELARRPELVLPNVTWLLPMARSFAAGERARSFKVEELYV